MNHSRATSWLRLTPAVLSIAVAGSCTVPPPQDGDRIGDAAHRTWGLARAGVATTEDGPQSVVIDIHLLDQNHYPELYGAAFALARQPGLVTIDHRININLPESEGFQAFWHVGDVHYAAQGYDPALSRVTDTHWKITIPLRTEEARTALANGGRVVINPYSSDFARGSVQGLAFQPDGTRVDGESAND
jgi:hypothetical protein